MTWKEFFEEAQQAKREISYTDRTFKIVSVGDDMVQLSGQEYREYLSYRAIVSVGDYTENGKTLAGC